MLIDQTPAMVAATALTFTVADVVKIVVAVFAVSGIIAQVRFNTRRIAAVEKGQHEQAKEMAKALADAIERVDANSKERHAALAGRQEQLEQRFLTAVEGLSNNMHQLSADLRAVVAAHEARLTGLEKKNEG